MVAPRAIRFSESFIMGTSNCLDILFSREDLRRRGARDRIQHPPIADDLFDSLLVKLRSASRPPTEHNRRSPSRGAAPRRNGEG